MSHLTNNLLNSTISKVSDVANYFTSKDNFNLLSNDKEILKIGNVLNSIFINRNNVDIPKLVVVGSQSSGKSSILNSILGMDILPTGTNMVTRGPLHLELIQSQSETKAVFGEYTNGEWIVINKIDIDFPNPSQEQKNNISSTIKRITTDLAGPGMNITNLPINLRIFSPHIPNLSLIDLPGLTMVACTDKGQPKDIKDKIKSLIGSYISNKNSIILSVMAARTDIEADIGLDLIKEYDPCFQRTIGVLTKIDLMNEGTDITHLLSNKISKDLQLKYGYFAIKNRNKLESETLNVIEGIKSEQTFFENHNIYSNKKYKNNLGIPNLCKNLGEILVKSLKRNFPIILEKINNDLLENKDNLAKLGTSIPENESQQSAFIHKTIAKLTREFISVIDDRGKIINTGRNIKSAFVDFRNNIKQINPFQNDKYPDLSIANAISNCEGNHMSCPSPAIEVLEQLLKDSSKKPIQSLIQPSQKCCQSIFSELNELIEILIKDLNIDRFPNFKKLIQTTFLEEVLLFNQKETYKQINFELLSQENYIWTEDINFIESLNNSKSNNVKTIRNLALKYFESILYVVQDTIPKKIMYFLVKESQRNIGSKLYEKIKDKNVTELLKEVDDIHEKRNILINSINELEKGKKLIESIL